MVLSNDWEPLDESLITSDICLECGRCCKTSWIQERYTTPKDPADRKDKFPYLQAMFELNPKSFVTASDDKVKVTNWCSQLMQDNRCRIYENRPEMCSTYNCFKAANGMKQLPEFYDHIKKLIDRKQKLEKADAV